MTSMSHNQDPPLSGRERALETLIDMDPQGSLYRAARALDEGVPQALSSRPNLVTRSALVEQAHSLARYEIDSAAKYNTAFRCPEIEKVEANISELHKYRVIRHYRKMMTFRDQSAPSHPVQLVHTLTRLCGESKVSKQMIKSVSSHSIYNAKNSNIDNVEADVASLECMMANLVEQKEPDLGAMLIATLSILTGSILEKEDNDTPKLGKGVALPKSTPKKLECAEDIPGLTIGGILSLLRPLEETRGTFSLDPAILDYLGNAAATYEERLEMQNSRSQDDAVVPANRAVEETTTCTSTAALDNISADTADPDREDDELSVDGALQLAQAAMDSSESDDSDFEEPQVEQEDSSDSDSEDEANAMDDEDLLPLALALSLAGRGFDDDSEDHKDEEMAQPEMPDLEHAEVRELPAMDNTHLPPLPQPPHYYPYFILTDDDNDDTASYVDPSALSKFGYVPASHAMVHTLRNAMSIILTARVSSSSQTQERAPTPGGMGFSLFATPPETRKNKVNDVAETALAVQLLVVTVLIMAENRNQAIDGLKQAILEEQHYVEEKEEPLSDEEEDPLAIADVAVASVASLTECLETKGMSRKAAAAANDAANRRKALRKRSDTWRDRAKLYSQCTLMSLRCLKHFLQGIVSTWLQVGGGLSAVDIHEFLPNTVWTKLSALLATLLSVILTRSLATLAAGDDSIEIEDLLMPFRIYHEAIVVWGECIPFFNPSKTSRSEILRSLILECFENIPPALCGHSILTLPSTEADAKMHRLQTLCKRLCVSDLMDGLVDQPIPFTTDDPEDVKEVKELPGLASTIVTILASSCAVLHDSGYIGNLHLALCHRLNIRGLLWDGLYLVSETEPDDVGSSNSSLTVSSTDAVRVIQTPSNSLAFDSLKCSDSIALMSSQSQDEGVSANGSSAHQRASKIWGTVLSSSHFSPKTGLHRWAVRLDKCERGHVFVGVATSQASTRTYVGGDKHGWGVIGTQALWHDRRKIRGDYGATFRTGSIIIITLDTDAGTLSFSSWKDTTGPISSFSLDPLLPSPRKQNQSSGGIVEEWGVAFEGLPLDAKLYPAVGLYQRDDRVTLLQVETGARSLRSGCTLNEVLVGGSCYFPKQLDSAVYQANLLTRLRSVKEFNDGYSLDILQYTMDTLQLFSKPSETLTHFQILAASTVLPSVAASLCLLPSSIPVLSKRLALALLPPITKCINAFEYFQNDANLFKRGLLGGKWTIRATGSPGSASSVGCEEYIVDLTLVSGEDNIIIGFKGSGVGTVGKSKNGLVKISGSTYGSSIHFEEEWTDVSDDLSSCGDDAASSCLVSARLSLDGTKFEGTYRNIQYGTTGHIAGILSSSLPEATEKNILLCQSLLCLAHGHLVGIVSEDHAGDLDSVCADSVFSDVIENLSVQRRRLLNEQLSSHLLSYGLVDHDHAQLNHVIDALKTFYSYRNLHLDEDKVKDVYPEILDTDLFARGGSGQVQVCHTPLQEVIAMDATLSPMNGGKGCLSIFCPNEYLNARHHLITCLLRHSHFEGQNKRNYLELVWRAALNAMEDGMRATLAREGEQGRHERAKSFCEQTIKSCLFLMQVQPNPESSVTSLEQSMADVVSFCSIISSNSDLFYLKSKMRVSMTRACLRAFAFEQVTMLLHHCSAETYQSGARHVIVDCIATSIPRLLGRSFNSAGRLTKTGSSDHEPISSGDLGTYFLAELSGAGLATLEVIRRNVHIILGGLALTAKGTGDREYGASSDSLLLSVLSCFMISFRPCDNDSIAEESSIFSVLPLILKSHRRSLVITHSPLFPSHESCCVPFLYRDTKDDVARAVLTAAVIVLHAFSYQVTQRESNSESMQSSLKCEGILLGELGETIPFLGVEIKNSFLRYIEQQSEEQYLKWLERSLQEDNSKASNVLFKKRKSISRMSGIGLSTFLQSGFTTMPSSQTKALKTSKSSGYQTSSMLCSSRGEDLLAMMGAPAQQYLSHLLHILSCIIASPLFPYLFTDSKWVEILLAATGLNNPSTIPLDNYVGSRAIGGHLLSGRYRARILRICVPLFARLTPDIDVIRGLFTLAGSSNPLMNRNVDDEDAGVCSEALSVLRRLHAVNQWDWRTAIEREMQVKLDTLGATFSYDSYTVGIVLFVSGKIETIHRGSFVLLRPAAATFLSRDVQTSPSSKSHGTTAPVGISGSNAFAPHHVVGNGTEGIVSGLCRTNASAGIVSNIEMNAGNCEVILLERRRQGEVVDRSVAQLCRRNQSRPALTVRALRTPLAALAQAEEMPLYLDESFPSEKFLTALLLSAIKQVDRSTNSDFDEETKQLSNIGNAFSLLVLRACIVLLSDERILAKFLELDDSRATLSKLLQLACKDKGSTLGIKSPPTNFLSSLASQEALFSHMSAMVYEINIRKALLVGTSEAIWTRRHEELVALGGEPCESLEDKNETQPAGVGGAPGISTETVPIPSDIEQSIRSHSNAISAGRNSSQSSFIPSNTVEEADDEAAATAAAHLREAAIAQMAELGLPRSWSELALRRTGGTNIEAAVHFCLERGGDMERLLIEERERERVLQRQSSSSASRRRGGRNETNTNHLLRQLLEMGFPSRWCNEALTATRNNVDEALTWILANGERLSAEDEGMDEDASDADEDASDSVEEESVDDEDVDEDIDDASTPFHETLPVDEESQQTENDSYHPLGGNVVHADETVTTVPGSLPPSDTPQNPNDPVIPKDIESKGSKVEKKCGNLGWSGLVTPLRFISGRSIIDPQTLAISGLPTGGFSSVGTKGVLLSSGKWYYEAILETAGCLQIGWADGSFAGHCHADRGDGCGDGPSSWAYDGWRRYRWHAIATEWGCRWKEGDVVGCLADMDEHCVSFTLNGRGEEIGMGEAFSGSGFRPCGGVYACVSFNRREKLRLILGGEGTESFRYTPPAGYRGVGEAVQESMKERRCLVLNEEILNTRSPNEIEGAGKSSRFMCDFSDGEHGHELFAWQHRYYGSDASVHLGSGRNSRQSVATQSANGTNGELSVVGTVSSRLEGVWSTSKVELDLSDNKLNFAKSNMVDTYDEMAKSLCLILAEVHASLGTLYARKLVLHLIVVLGERFDLNAFTPLNAESAPQTNELETALQLWEMLDACVSLRAAGWVGEAGAMAIAAETLGLGISTNDHPYGRHFASTCRRGISSSLTDEPFMVPVTGLSQLLSTVVLSIEPKSNPVTRDTGSSLAACAEAVIGADGGGGPLVFLQRGLQSAACKSQAFREVIVAVVRRSVRQLAVIDYSGDDSAQSEATDDDELENSIGTFDKSKGGTRDEEDEDKFSQPDARLASFLSGLLLSNPVQASVRNTEWLMGALFEAWSIGLLSASAPWRMVCALTASGILSMAPAALVTATNSIPALQRYYCRLPGIVARRVWAERAAVPVCSRYVQALVELLACVRRAVAVSEPPVSLHTAWQRIKFDAATPIPLDHAPMLAIEVKEDEPLRGGQDYSSWEWMDGWLSHDSGWEVWTGMAEFAVVDWKSPSRSAVRTLMDGGEGPPMLREGCIVMRGFDWEEDNNDDGKMQYEREKAEREKEKKIQEEQVSNDTDPASSPQPVTDDDHDPVLDAVFQDHKDGPTNVSDAVGQAASQGDVQAKSRKRKKLPNPKLPTGTVLAIEAWNGIPAMSRRVKWDRTGIEGVYRYGGDGGRFDICHVDVNDKCTRVRKKHPLPESTEQCASRHGFGSGKKYSMVLRLRGMCKGFRNTSKQHREGVLEWPDFGAGVRVDCIFHKDSSITVEEKELLYGSKDSGWEARFGQPSFIPHTKITFTPSNSTLHAYSQAEMDTKSSFLSMYVELVGSSSRLVKAIRHRDNGETVRVSSTFRLLRGRTTEYDTGHDVSSLCPPPLSFDSDFHASSMALSHDGRTVTCVSPDGRGTAFASIGFTKGVHYWEVKLEQADIGSVFIGVAEKPSGSGSGSSLGNDGPARLNRWIGWGLVNFRATYTSGAERVYGAHCHHDDTVGVLLDCDAGRISFFYDGLKYGEHILNDLGCAFENLSPFGFNADGCGSGGAGQGAPSAVEVGRGSRYPAHGAVRPRALWPVVGLRNPGDRVTFSTKWMTSLGVDSSTTLKNILAVDEILSHYDMNSKGNDISFPEWFVRESYHEFKRWEYNRWFRTETRASGPNRLASVGLDVEVDSSPIACAAACAGLGLRRALLHGDRVVVKRSAGRILELSEEAIILGSYQGRLYYRIVSQKSEGGSLTEGGGRAWFWDESEAVDDSLQLVGVGRGLDIDLPLIDRFTCLAKGGLRIVYEGGAIVRSDVEIFDRSENIGLISQGVVIPQIDVLERRVNSCGVVRYRVRYEGVGEGWISSRIRGGKEEPIVEPVDGDEHKVETEVRFPTPIDSARAWYKTYEKASKSEATPFTDISYEVFTVKSFDEFKSLISDLPEETSSVQLDKVISSLVRVIADFSESGDAVECSFAETVGVVCYAIASLENKRLVTEHEGNPMANEAAAAVLANVKHPISVKCTLARMSILRAFNRRMRQALPWLSVRPSQEGSAILGGLCGHGALAERVGRQKSSKSMELWVQVPSIASRIRDHRGLIFGSVKRLLLDSITFATTTPTPLSHDEYELPREIRTVRVNRLKASRAMAGSDNLIKRKHSVFSQLQNETRSWGGAALRRGFVAKGHGGQKRAFKVKLVGEGVNDYSGPYREVFTDAIRDVVESDGSGHGVLGVLDPTPNTTAQLGDNRDLHMFSLGDHDLQAVHEGWRSDEELRIKRSFSILTAWCDESSREIGESVAFLGRLVGTACRHGIPVDLPLPMNTVWKAIVEEATDEIKSLREIDLLASRQFTNPSLECPPLMLWQRRMLNSFIDGMSNVLPVEVLTLFSGKELREIMCGNPEVDVDLLKRVVEYEGYEESDPVITYFWEALREMTAEERKRFLQFVWARSRLPIKESDFDAPFKIIRASEKSSDQTLPSASTCFFSLTLPPYSSKEILTRKLLFAIENVCTMESDFVTNDAEVGEGWRGL